MARAHSIYILTAAVTGIVVGTFTVKHEMETARSRSLVKVNCVRYRDNEPFGAGRSCDEGYENHAGELMCDVRIPQISGITRP